MPYPYKPGLENYSPYKKTLSDLAVSPDTSEEVREKFCSGFDKVCAYALDELKKPLATLRAKQAYKSADAVYKGQDERFYFIEFKCQPYGNVDWDDVSVKAVDSLTIAGYMFANDQKLADLMGKSVFILVYKNSPDMKLTDTLAKLAGGRIDKQGEPILSAGLKKLMDNSFYSEVHTWTPEAFRRHFIEHLP